LRFRYVAASVDAVPNQEEPVTIKPFASIRAPLRRDRIHESTVPPRACGKSSADGRKEGEARSNITTHPMYLFISTDIRFSRYVQINMCPATP
jgi:hypothetical protein